MCHRTAWGGAVLCVVALSKDRVEFRLCHTYALAKLVKVLVAKLTLLAHPDAKIHLQANPHLLRCNTVNNCCRL